MRVTMLVLLLSLGTLILGAFYIIMFDRKIDITVIWQVKAVFPLVFSHPCLAGLPLRTQG